MIRPPPRSPLFPYTTLFRPERLQAGQRQPRARVRRPGAGRVRPPAARLRAVRSEEHTSELQSHVNLVCRLLLEKKKQTQPDRDSDVASTVQAYLSRSLCDIV